MEKRKLVLTGCEPKDIGNGRTIYNCVTAGGQKFSSWSAKVKEYLNKEHEFDVFMKETVGKDGNTYQNWFLKFEEENKGGGGGFQKRPYQPSFKDSQTAVILSARTMLLSYVKDLTVA